MSAAALLRFSWPRLKSRIWTISEGTLEEI